MNEPASEVKGRVMRSSRPTIMDGEVVTFAQHFSQEPGVFGVRDVAEGAYKISASRNRVIVERCELTGREALNEAIEALQMAFSTFERLARQR